MVLRTMAFVCALLSFPAFARAQDVGNYPLDAVSRRVPARGPMRCPDVGLRSYSGTSLRYTSTLRVHPEFALHLAAFERLVREVAVAHYGRAPRKVVHLGSYNCRRIRLYPNDVSEHGLGNALDVAGFDFGPAAKNDPLPPNLPPSRRRPFRVRMLARWNDTSPRGAPDRAFLRDLAQRVIDEPDLFRVVLGPSWPGHGNHLHLDYAPYRMVVVF